MDRGSTNRLSFKYTAPTMMCFVDGENETSLCKCASLDTLLLNCGPLKRKVLCECLIISALHWPCYKTLPYYTQIWVAQYAVWCASIALQDCSFCGMHLWKWLICTLCSAVHMAVNLLHLICISTQSLISEFQTFCSISKHLREGG
jgi:hypothetical protein